MITFSNGTPKETFNKLIFLHIPKTGGTSVEYSLQRAFGTGKERHYNIRQMQGVLKNENIEEYKIFTVIRNPFDRIISTWRWWVYHSDGYSTRPFLNHKQTPITSFKDYLLMIKDYFDGDADLLGGNAVVDKEKAPLTITHVEKLDWWLTKNDRTLVKCDFLKFENLNQEWKKIKKELKIKPTLFHKNESKMIPFTKSREKLYDSETYKIASKIYKDEIRRFGYE
tara:strand:- start:74 stop:748 length:675 start_codon:yes stop_codon:yes gene_type:complete